MVVRVSAYLGTIENTMEPRTRHHPHSRQQWAGIRPRFTRLYLDEGRKLSEVVQILSAEGFNAQ